MQYQLLEFWGNKWHPLGLYNTHEEAIEKKEMRMRTSSYPLRIVPIPIKK